MKKLSLVLFCFFAVYIVEAQTYQTLTDHNGTKMYKGFITDSLFKTDTAFAWYNEAQTVFTPKQKVVDVLQQNKDSVYFLIFMGTWCGDSKFVIPRFFKGLEAANYDKNKITLIAVDRAKKDLNNLAATFNITNVPTIIAYKNGKELGRVIEYGNTGKYDEEMADIIKNAK